MDLQREEEFILLKKFTLFWGFLNLYNQSLNIQIFNKTHHLQCILCNFQCKSCHYYYCYYFAINDLQQFIIQCLIPLSHRERERGRKIKDCLLDTFEYFEDI